MVVGSLKLNLFMLVVDVCCMRKSMMRVCKRVFTSRTPGPMFGVNSSGLATNGLSKRSSRHSASSWMSDAETIVQSAVIVQSHMPRITRSQASLIPGSACFWLIASKTVDQIRDVQP